MSVLEVEDKAEEVYSLGENNEDDLIRNLRLPIAPISPLIPTLKDLTSDDKLIINIVNTPSLRKNVINIKRRPTEDDYFN